MEFASHRDARIRETIALRPDCPMGVLATLAFDGDRGVRRAVAASPRIASAIAAELATDRDQEVLKTLARNAATDGATLRTLAGHRRSEVKRLARKALDARESRDQDGSEAVVAFPARAAADAAVPPELRDRWRPAEARTSPSHAHSEQRFHAPRPAVPSRPSPPVSSGPVAEAHPQQVAAPLPPQGQGAVPSQAYQPQPLAPGSPAQPEWGYVFQARS